MLCPVAELCRGPALPFWAVPSTRQWAKRTSAGSQHPPLRQPDFHLFNSAKYVYSPVAYSEPGPPSADSPTQLTHDSELGTAQRASDSPLRARTRALTARARAYCIPITPSAPYESGRLLGTLPGRYLIRGLSRPPPPSRDTPRITHQLRCQTVSLFYQHHSPSSLHRHLSTRTVSPLFSN